MVKKVLCPILMILIVFAVSGSAVGLDIFNSPSDYNRLTGNNIQGLNEAPQLAQLVAEGKLPPVNERLPVEPIIVNPRDEIGLYGGEFVVASLGPRWEFESYPARRQRLLKMAPDMQTIVPNIAKGYTLSEDLKTLTVTLREGMRWSDGEPFTANDILFWYEDIFLNEDLTPVKPVVFTPGREPMKVTKINEYSVQFSFSRPNPAVLFHLRGNEGEVFAPKHYLKDYHIRYNPNVEEEAIRAGFDTWFSYFENVSATGANQQNPDLPSLETWVLKSVSPTNKVFERNPYYYKVDSEGNQLPYVDSMIVLFHEEHEVIGLRAMSGLFSYVRLPLLLRNVPLYGRQEKEGNYTTHLVQAPLGSALGFGFNPTHSDPVLRELFNDVRFKQAMSLAINREEINEQFFMGLGTPRQATTTPDALFYEEWMGSHYADYNPQLANQLLDQIGLEWDANKEYRLRPDGQTLSVTISSPHTETIPHNEALELIKEYWEAVGVNTDYRIVERTLHFERGDANRNDVAAFQLGGNANEINMFQTRALLFRPPWGVLRVGVPWQTWYQTRGAQGEEPPEHVKELYATIDEWSESLPGSEEYKRLGKQILATNLEHLFYIGTVGLVPEPLIVSNDLRNAPRSGDYWAVEQGFAELHMPEQWFFIND